MGSTGDTASLRAYREELSRIPALSREEEREEARRWAAGDKSAGDRIVRACLPFVVSIAIEYRKWGVPLEDLVQQGNLGLLRAAAKFDVARECRLSTYAAFWIRAEIREHVVRAYRVVRLGTTKSERRALRFYRTSQDQSPEALAKASGLSVARVERLLPMLAARETSLDANTNLGPAVSERLSSDAPSPEEEASVRESRSRAKSAVDVALRGLNERERMIVEARAMSDEPVTLQALGEKLGVSKERVRQLEERAYGKLRSTLGPELGGAFELKEAG